MFLFWASNSLAQNKHNINYSLYAGFSAQTNWVSTNAINTRAEPGFTRASSNGIGVPVGVSFLHNFWILDVRLVNRYTKVVDNWAVPNVDDVFKIVQDVHIGIGKNLKGDSFFLRDASFKIGFSLFNIAQPYLGGRIWVLENNQNGSPVWVEKKPSFIQFPSLFLSYSKQLFKNCDVEVAFTGYNKKWRRPELNNNGLNTMLSVSVLYHIFQN